jgi:hypothetical protein
MMGILSVPGKRAKLFSKQKRLFYAYMIVRLLGNVKEITKIHRTRKAAGAKEIQNDQKRKGIIV